MLFSEPLSSIICVLRQLLPGLWETITTPLEFWLNQQCFTPTHVFGCRLKHVPSIFGVAIGSMLMGILLKSLLEKPTNIYQPTSMRGMTVGLGQCSKSSVKVCFLCLKPTRQEKTHSLQSCAPKTAAVSSQIRRIKRLGICGVHCDLDVLPVTGRLLRQTISGYATTPWVDVLQGRRLVRVGWKSTRTGQLWMISILTSSGGKLRSVSIEPIECNFFGHWVYLPVQNADVGYDLLLCSGAKE